MQSVDQVAEDGENKDCIDLKIEGDNENRKASHKIYLNRIQFRTMIGSRSLSNKLQSTKDIEARNKEVYK